MTEWASVEGDPRRVFAPEVHRALGAAVASVRAAAPAEALELIRQREAMLLGFTAELDAPAWGAVSAEKVASIAAWSSAPCFDEAERAALALGEQFAIDITGVATGPLTAAASAFGASVLALVQGIFLIDVGQRCAKALGRLFNTTVTSADWATTDAGVAIDPDSMAAVGTLLRETAKLSTLDPVLRELVRMRGAHHHQCRRCQAVRSVAAIEAGADEQLLAATLPGAEQTLSQRSRTALLLTDAVLLGTVELSDELVTSVKAELSATEAVELICYVMRNSANKIAVAFGADAAIVDEGFEYQLIDADGETLTVEAPASL
jgi:alkylhydroperoxidase family enzyme